MRNPYPATAILNPLEKNSGVCKISWPISTQARQLPTAIRVMLYERLFSTAQPCQALNTAPCSNRDSSASRSSYLMAGAVGTGCFLE